MAQLVTGTFEYTLEEAQLAVLRAPSHTRLQLMVRALLPTGNNRGFEGQTCITVSRQAMADAIGSMGRVFCTKRGAKVRLHVTAPDREGGLGFSACY